MGWTGTGSYSRVHSFSADSSASIKILASRMDAEFDDFASAMTVAVAKDGQNTPTANLPMGGFRHNNVGAAASATNYLRASQFIADIPVFVKEAVAGTDTLKVSASFFASVSANQSPPDGTRLKVQVFANRVTATCAIHLYTPTNTSAGGQPHIAAIYSRGSRFEPGCIQGGRVHEFSYDSSASAWRLLNPYVSDAITFSANVKCMDATGAVVAGRDSVAVQVKVGRFGDYVVLDTTTTASVSCSVSAFYVIFSAGDISAMTSGANANSQMIPVMVKDTLSPAWKAQIRSGAPGAAQLVLQPAFLVDGITVSANTTVKVGANTYIFHE